MQNEQGRLQALLEPLRSQAIADATGRTRQLAHAWRTGISLPDPAAIVDLARLLRMDVGELTCIVAADGAAMRARREVARAS